MTQITHQIAPTAAPTPPANVTAPPEPTPAAQTFLEAILYKDVVTLRTFGIDDKTAAAIDLKLQVDVAQKLLASENAVRRAQSKRVLAAQAGITSSKANPPANVTQAPAQRATFYRSVTDAQKSAA